jgi:hypothetical protein
MLLLKWGNTCLRLGLRIHRQKVVNHGDEFCSQYCSGLVGKGPLMKQICDVIRCFYATKIGNAIKYSGAYMTSFALQRQQNVPKINPEFLR